MIHNTPFGDIVDTEDDLQPYLYKGIEKAIRVFCILNAVIRTMKVEEDTLKRRSYKHAITITDFADVLTKTMASHFGMLIMRQVLLRICRWNRKRSYMNYVSKM